jgi:hypothetical protein
MTDMNKNMVRWGSYPDVKTKQERAVEVTFVNGDKRTWQPAAMTRLNGIRPFVYNIETADGVEVSIPSSAVLAVVMSWVPAKENG